MYDKLLSPSITPDAKPSFRQAATDFLSRRSKVKKKMKSLSRALSLRKKSWNLSTCSPTIFQDGEYTGSYDQLTSPVGLEQTDVRTSTSSKSKAVTNLTKVYDGMAKPEITSSEKGEFLKSSAAIISEKKTKVEHDGKSAFVVELEENTNSLDVISQQVKNLSKLNLKSSSPKPPIVPPVTLKEDLVSDPQMFQLIDRHVIKISQKEYVDVQTLLQDLLKNAQSELEKARALFRWVIAVNQKSARVSRSITSDSIGTGRVQYQKLFHELCREAGLHSEIIVGYSKGAGYRPGMRVDQKAYRNSWTAVAIDGTWRFVNCMWGARHTTGSSVEFAQLLHKYDEFYFLTDPAEHIYQHFPDDPKWQLLETPLSLEEFTALPILKSPFFKHGFEFTSSYSSVIKTEDDKVNLKLKAPGDVRIESRLQDCDSERQVQNHVLVRRMSDEVILTVYPPNPGCYDMSVYAGNGCTSNYLECIFSVRIVKTGTDCVSKSIDSPPFPLVSCLGATSEMTKLNISANSHHDPLICMAGNALRIDFDVTADTKSRHTLQYYERQRDCLVDIERYAFVRSRTDSELSYSVSCPRKGSYVFSLYGATSDSETYVCLHQYLLICPTDNLSYVAFPKSSLGWRNCSLISPLCGDLVQGTEYTFNIVARDVSDVFVMIGLDKQHLEKTKEGKWTGKVSTGSLRPRATVIAEHWSDNGNSYYTRLLTYDIL